MAVKSSLPAGEAPANKDLLILAWVDQAPPQVEVTGRAPGQQTTSLVYTRVGYQLSRQQRLVLPPGMISGSIVQYPQDGSFCGEPGTTGVYLANGEAIFEFYLPEQTRGFQVERLNLALWTDMGWWQAPQIAFYDWSTSDWRSLADPQQGENQVVDAGNLVSEAGLVQVRLVGQNMQGCFYLDLGLEAMPPGEPGGQS
jgi:hypothetical protein